MMNMLRFMKYLLLGCLTVSACGEVTPGKIKKAMAAIEEERTPVPLPVEDNPAEEAYWDGWDFSGALAQFPGACPVDEPEDLNAYFQDIHRRGAQIWVCDGEADSLYVWHAIDELNRFGQGQRTYYPKDEVQRAVALMNEAIEQRQQDLGMLDADQVYPGEAFLFRFMEQAARLSPQIDFLTDQQSPDYQAGIYCRQYSCNPPMYAFLVYRADDRYKVELIGHKEQTTINHIYQFSDEQNRTYYLCSNHETSLSFAQYLYMGGEEGLESVCSTLLFQAKDIPDDNEIFFDPETRCWNFCVKREEGYRKVRGTRTLNLVLNGNRSFFRLI